MDNTIGTDYFCVFYSKNPLDLNDLSKKIEAESGTFNQKVEKVLESELVDFKTVKYLGGNKIGFSVKSKTKSLVVLIVEIEHVR